MCMTSTMVRHAGILALGEGCSLVGRAPSLVRTRKRPEMPRFASLPGADPAWSSAAAMRAPGTATSGARLDRIALTMAPWAAGTTRLRAASGVSGDMR